MEQGQTGWDTIEEPMEFGESMDSHTKDKEASGAGEEQIDPDLQAEMDDKANERLQADFGGDVAPKDSPHEPVFRERIDDDDILAAEEQQAVNEPGVATDEDRA